MAKRSGLSTFLRTCHGLCVLFAAWKGTMVAAIDASSATPENKQKLKDLIDTIQDACSAVDSIRVVWEN